MIKHFGIFAKLKRFSFANISQFRKNNLLNAKINVRKNYSWSQFQAEVGLKRQLEDAGDGADRYRLYRRPLATTVAVAVAATAAASRFGLTFRGWERSAAQEVKPRIRDTRAINQR
jgi:hypothetical protein